MLKIYKNVFFFNVIKKTHKRKVRKAKKGKVAIVNAWKHRWIGDRKLSLCKTIKYQLNIEKKV